jgi:hypothetical protein
MYYNGLNALSKPFEYKTIFGEGNTTTKMRSIYLNVAEQKNNLQAWRNCLLLSAAIIHLLFEGHSIYYLQFQFMLEQSFCFQYQ